MVGTNSQMYVFETHGLVEQKRRGKLYAYFLHGLTHYLAAVILVGFFIAGSTLLLRTHLVILALSLVHVLIDFAKIRLAQKALVKDGAIAYISDQFLHFLSVALAAWLLSPGLPFAEVTALPTIFTATLRRSRVSNAL